MYKLPENSLPGNLLACDNAILNAGNKGSRIRWNTGDTTSIVNTTISGVFSVEIKNANGCKVFAESDVTVHQSPFLYLGSDKVICRGTSITLNAENLGSTYKWQDGSAEQTLKVTTAGYYKVEVTNMYNCTSSDEIQVRIANPVNLSLGPDITFCPGSHLWLDGGIANTYLWQSNVSLTGSSKVLQVDKPGSYWLEATGEAGCFERDTITILSTNDTLQAEFLAASQIYQGEEIKFLELSLGDASEYFWSFGDGSTSNEPSPSKVYFTPGLYKIILVAFNGSCNDTLVKFITVKSNEDLRKPEEEQSVITGSGISFADILNFNIYPNPTEQEFTYSIKLSNEAITGIMLIDSQTNIIYNKEMNNMREIEDKIDLKLKPSGIYIMRIMVNGKYQTKKLTKL